MGETKRCAIIIEDDFNNVLIISKGKKSSPIAWQCLGREKKGKESNEKCVNNIGKEELNTLLFDVELKKEIEIKEEKITLFTAKLKEYINLGKNVKAIDWVNEKTIDKYDFLPGEKEIYLEYFKLTD